MSLSESFRALKLYSSGVGLVLLRYAASNATPNPSIAHAGGEAAGNPAIPWLLVERMSCAKRVTSSAVSCCAVPPFWSSNGVMTTRAPPVVPSASLPRLQFVLALAPGPGSCAVRLVAAGGHPAGCLVELNHWPRTVGSSETNTTKPSWRRSLGCTWLMRPTSYAAAACAMG